MPAIVPTPSYPIHIYGPLFAGADLRQVPMKFLADPSDRETFTEDFMESLHTAYDVGLAQATGAGDVVPPQPDPVRSSISISCSRSSTSVANAR